MNELKAKDGMKRYWVIFTTMASIGLLTPVVLSIIEGMKYRVREEQGLDPIMAPTWVVIATYAGLAVFVVALLGLAVISSVALGRRQDRESLCPVSPNAPPST
jgi:hypothetical protein